MKRAQSEPAAGEKFEILELLIARKRSENALKWQI